MGVGALSQRLVLQENAVATFFLCFGCVATYNEILFLCCLLICRAFGIEEGMLFVLEAVAPRLMQQVAMEITHGRESGGHWLGTV